MRAASFAFGLVGLFGLSLTIAVPAQAQGTTYTTIERGRYLVNAGDCASCHTDQGGKPYAGGLALPTPFGIIYSTNITPDRQPASAIGPKKISTRPCTTASVATASTFIRPSLIPGSPR